MKDLVSLETAKLAKKKGFNLCSPAYYGCDDPQSGIVLPNQLFIRDWIKISELEKIESQKGTLIYSAPTQTQLQKWLREKKNILVYVEHSGGYWEWVVEYAGGYFEDIDPYNREEESRFEKTLELGLQKGLSLI